MDDLTVSDIVRGIVDESMKSQRVPLLELLANKVGESTEPLTEQECKEVFVIAISKLDADTDSTLISIFLSLLTNATINDQNARKFIKFLTTSDKYSTQFHKALEIFLNHNPQIEQEDDVDVWENMASVVCNLCQIEEGRALILKQSLRYMERLVNQVRSRHVVRRRGAVGSIRSCLFDQEIHWWIVVEVKVVDHIALPLIVGTPFTEQEKVGMSPVWWLLAESPDRLPDPEVDIQKMLLECIVLLCQRRGIREELRKMKVYNVVKNLDMHQENEEINQIICEIVNLLMGDEDHRTPIDRYTPLKEA